MQEGTNQGLRLRLSKKQTSGPCGGFVPFGDNHTTQLHNIMKKCDCTLFLEEENNCDRLVTTPSCAYLHFNPRTLEARRHHRAWCNTTCPEGPHSTTRSRRRHYIWSSVSSPLTEKRVGSSPPPSKHQPPTRQQHRRCNRRLRRRVAHLCLRLLSSTSPRCDGSRLYRQSIKKTLMNRRLTWNAAGFVQENTMLRQPPSVPRAQGESRAREGWTNSLSGSAHHSGPAADDLPQFQTGQRHRYPPAAIAASVDRTPPTQAGLGSLPPRERRVAPNLRQ
mmetsp:Transcript_49807/g.132132  ORF Transcript_49807/g.132132 Transcript_49807/m.132132 type:complete len:277 (-) Transcript_49807:880-1710(-)